MGRYGGEEFVILLPHTDEEGATVLAERIRRVICEHTWANRQITVSVGAATFVQGDTHGMGMIKQADAAMYHSKKTGRNRATHIRALENADGRTENTTFDSPAVATA